MTDPRATIRTFILSEFMPGEPASSLTDDMPLRANGVMDSMGVVRLVDFLAETFGIEVQAPEVDVGGTGSVDAIVALVEEKRGG